MKELGLAHLGQPLQECGWHFSFDHAKRRLGACHMGDRGKQITISAPLARRNGLELMEDVLRHEIAHAVDYENRGKTDHGPAWKRWARRCGANPNRLYEGEDLQEVPSKYVGVCPAACGYEAGFHRMIKRWYYCPDCSVKGRGAKKAFLRIEKRRTGEVVRRGGTGSRPPRQ